MGGWGAAHFKGDFLAQKKPRHERGAFLSWRLG